MAAYEGLPQELRDLAGKLRATHSYSLTTQFASGRNHQQAQDTPLLTVHPIVRVHPETGERALYVSPTFTGPQYDVEGLSRRQSQQVLEMFYDAILRPEYTVRFHWEPGSIAFCDNRSTAHLAPFDVDHLGIRRIMRRITLEGDIPVGTDGRPSTSLVGEPFLGRLPAHPGRPTGAMS